MGKIQPLVIADNRPRRVGNECTRENCALVGSVVEELAPLYRKGGCVTFIDHGMNPMF